LAIIPTGMSGDQVYEATNVLCAKLRDCLAQARSRFARDPAAWVEEGVGGELGPAIGEYAKIFSSLHLASRQELEHAFKANFKSVKVQDVYEELVELEENWTELVDKVDQELAGGQNTLILREEDHIPGHTALKTIRNEVVELRDLVQSGDRFVHMILLRHFA